MIARIPRVDRLSRSIVEYPARARFHAFLMETAPEHVVVVAHHNPVPGVDDRHLFAGNVQGDARFLKLFDWRARLWSVAVLQLVVRDAEKPSPQ